MQAQIDYTHQSSFWYLPARYYTLRRQLSGSNYMTLIVLDTSPCVADYRQDNPDYWDPCSSQYPTCSLDDTDDDFQGPCKFHDNILSQDCTAQYNWLQSTLQGVPAEDWLIVMGHHPIDEVDMKDLTSLIQNHGFSLYLNGHAHTLTQYTIDGTGAYITTGAGSLVNTASQSHLITSLKVSGKDVGKEVYERHRNSLNASLDLKAAYTHTYQTVFNQKVAGFTSHTFSDDFSTLTTNFVAYTGDIIHTFTVNKKGQFVN
ncbi:hypothetical protein EON65_17560 [archaeon]|nr:MAG: hypothetical protein EON65_17560 [archaeon]